MSVRERVWEDGTPCWVDYGAADLAAAESFYGRVLGWTFDATDEEHGGYVMCRRDGRAAAGMMPRQGPDQPVAWTTYLATSDAGRMVERVTAAGGTVVVPPVQVGPEGTMAVVLDTEGHGFGLWQAGEFIGAEVVGEVGALVWNDVAAVDPAAAQVFYGSLFDYAFDAMEGQEYATFRTGERPLGGVGRAGPGTVEGWTCCFAVASTDDAVAAVREAGGDLLAGPHDTPFGRYAVLADPWGASFSVMQLPPG